ncbi:hypothetical protein [Pseudomonas sp. Irchel s3f7]|uniref:hypothetical protein n=1 Tax=Pseudomonas sp. Irchel s3f7 TaxID=2009153 RepID=UPI000BA39591|nr:hypothetical protein [Pseudomonas sp. Irchel s3f7]
MGYLELETENSRLHAENEVLRAEIHILKGRLTLLDTHQSLAKGMRGETLVANWITGSITIHNAAHDVETAAGLIRLEIKYSGLNVADRNRKLGGLGTQRWAWSKPFGESSKKKYDRLILVGDKDPRYIDQYQGIDCPYVLFDVPFNEILPLTIQTNRGHYRSIQLTTNPKKAKSAASALFSKYQVSLDELTKLYGL